MTASHANYAPSLSSPTVSILWRLNMIRRETYIPRLTVAQDDLSCASRKASPTVGVKSVGKPTQGHSIALFKDYRASESMRTGNDIAYVTYSVSPCSD